MINVSIIVPAIRTNKWLRFYESIEKSCKKYTWELILISPFELPDTLKDKNNIKLIKDFGHPTRCLQLGIFEASGDLIYHTTDDAIMFENAMDEAIDFYYENCGYKDVINMKYREGKNYSGDSMPNDYWWAWFHGPLQLPGIPRNYKISLHHMLKTNYLIQLGGYNCQYHHANFSLHDLMFRVQYDGGRIFDSPKDITTCDHYIDKTVDHGAIFDSHNNHDLPLFQKIYSNNNALTQENTCIDINNWANEESVWLYRFSKGIPEKYEGLI